MGLGRIPEGMSVLTMPRGVNAPIWHLHTFSHQHIRHHLAWLQMGPFLSRRTKCKWIALFPVCSFFFFLVFSLKCIHNNRTLDSVLASHIHWLENSLMFLLSLPVVSRKWNTFLRQSTKPLIQCLGFYSLSCQLIIARGRKKKTHNSDLNGNNTEFNTTRPDKRSICLSLV